jgi:ubiquinone/menaquinone biosynthesis C-methylase UbiE
MKTFERCPTDESGRIVVADPALPFDHPDFIDGALAERAAAMHESSATVYSDERRFPWDDYFGIDLRPLLEGRSALDLGCFTGGRAVAWLERYGLASITGIDRRADYVEAARLFAQRKGVQARFEVAAAEELPFDEGTFDVVLSFDVFEHVSDPHRALRESCRVVKSGGWLLLVFPGYFQPFEHHLGHVTAAPLIHWLFSGRTLVRAYHEILSERGAAAAWYNRSSPELEPWERGHTLNGLTAHSFGRLLQDTQLRVVHHPQLPLGAVGRRASVDWRVRSLSKLFSIGARLPLVRELCLHRLVFILARPCAVPRRAAPRP